MRWSNYNDRVRKGRLLESCTTYSNRSVKQHKLHLDLFQFWKSWWIRYLVQIAEELYPADPPAGNDDEEDEEDLEKALQKELQDLKKPKKEGRFGESQSVANLVRMDEWRELGLYHYAISELSNRHSLWSVGLFAFISSLILTRSNSRVH